MSQPINFKSTKSHNLLVSKTNVNVTKEDCKTIYNNIKNKLPIFNPKSKLPIVYHSPITQKILKICYKKYKMKKLPDVIDPRNLFGNKTPPQLSPASSASSGSLSPPSNFKKHSSSPLPSSSSLPPSSPLSPLSPLPSPPGAKILSPPGAKIKKPPPPPIFIPPPHPQSLLHSNPISPPGAKIKKPPQSPPGAKIKKPPQSPPGAKIKKQSSSISSSSSYGPPGTPSPPSSRPSSPLPPPSTKIKKPSKSPPGAKKTLPLDFSDVKDTIKTADQKLKFNDLTDDECMYVINQIISKKPIINPRSTSTIGNKSSITKYILYSCYYDRNIKDVANVAKISTLCDEPPAIKNKYLEIYDKFKELKLNYSDDKLNKLFNDSELDKKYLDYFKLYIESCKKIEKQTKIEIFTLNKHMEIIFKLCFIETTNIISCFDDIFLNDLKSLNNDISIKENILSVNFINYLIYNDIYNEYLNPFYIEDKKIILKNSIFNRIYVFKQYLKQNKYTFAPFDKYIINKNTDLSEIMIMIQKDNKTLPKYFAHTFNDTTNVNNKLNYITAFLTVFAEDFISNIEITDNDSIKYFNQISSLIPNINEREYQDLTSVLFNNTVFNKMYINKKIISNNFSGTLCHSTIDKITYLHKLNSYQNYNILEKSLKNIENAYKNTGIYPFSKDLNIELSNFIIDPNITLSQSIKKRLIDMFEFVKFASLNVDYKKSLFVFHGTSGKLNSDLLTSFLSTSFNINVAIDYSRRNANPHIYVFRINKNNIKYINFNDGLQQLLLLPGTRILENNLFNYNNFNFVICDLEIPDSDYINNLINRIDSNNTKYKLTSYPFKIKNYTINDYLKIISYPVYDVSIFRNNVYKTSDNKYLICNILEETAKIKNKFLNLKYTIHQLIINNIYYYFLEDNIIKYNLIDFNNGEIFTGWKYDNTLSPIITRPDYKYDFNFLMIDILCNNFDLINNLSYLMTTNFKVKKVWFKTTGIFNGLGVQTITLEDIKKTSVLNERFEKDINTIINTNEIYTNNKQDITSIIILFYSLIKKFKSNKIIDTIIDQYKYLINNILDIGKDTEEYKELLILLDTIKEYFNAKVEYILSLDKNKLIQDINIYMPKTSGGKNIFKKTNKLQKEKREETPYKEHIVKDTVYISKTKSSKQKMNIYMDTDTTTFDKYGYEIAPQHYSSMHTISYASFKAINKKYKI